MRKWIGPPGGRGDADHYRGRREPTGVGQRPVPQFHLGPAGEQRPDDHRDRRGRDLVGQQVGLGSVIDHQVIPELPGHPHRGRDVIGAMAMLPPRDFPAKNTTQGLELEVALHHRSFGRWVILRRGQFRLVVQGGHERAAYQCRGTQPRRRKNIPFPVDPLGVLAERGLQAGRLAQHHLVDRAAPALDRHGLAADRVGRTGVDVDREHAARDGVAEAQVGRVDRIDRADLRGDRFGPLVRVLAGPALGLLVHPGVGVGVDEPREHPLAGSVHHVHAGRHGEAGTLDRSDLPVPQQDDPAVQRLALDRDDPAPDYRGSSGSSGSSGARLAHASPSAARPRSTRFILDAGHQGAGAADRPNTPSRNCPRFPHPPDSPPAAPWSPPGERTATPASPGRTRSAPA